MTSTEHPRATDPANAGRTQPANRVGTDQKPPPRQPVTYTCGGCDNRWGGVSRAHCSGCHRTFTGAATFDQHRRDIKGVGTCIDPATLLTKGTQEPTQVFRDGLWRSTREFSGAGELFGGEHA